MAKKKNSKKTATTMKSDKTTQKNLPNGWFYMSTEMLDVGNLQEAISWETEIWREAGVLEVILEPKISIDIEVCDLDLGDDYSNEYLEKHKIRSLFYVSFKPEAYDLCVPVIKEIIAVHGGMLCGDTDDFTPVIK